MVIFASNADGNGGDIRVGGKEYDCGSTCARVLEGRCEQCRVCMRCGYKGAICCDACDRRLAMLWECQVVTDLGSQGVECVVKAESRRSRKFVAEATSEEDSRFMHPVYEAARETVCVGREFVVVEAGKDLCIDVDY